MKRSLFTAMVLLAVTLGTASAEMADLCFEHLPPGCLVIKSEVIPQPQTDAIGNKLGVPLKKVSNTVLKVQGKPIQVNILEARTDAGAMKLYEKLSATKPDPAFCLHKGTKVIEFCKADASTAIKTAYALGLAEKPKQIQYSLSATIATVDKADYMACNELFNVMLQTNIQQPGSNAMARIKSLTSGFSFGKTLTLRKQPQGSNAYELLPRPLDIETLPHDQMQYAFSQPSDICGIPCIKLKAHIACNDAGWTPTDRKADESLLSSTSYWPVDDPQIQRLARKITSGKHTQDAKVQAILEWLTPNTNIKMDGPTGSRWGVLKVLDQKYGHCWDFSDCFITLARAASIPSRQVGGWLYGTGGHVWAEVLVPGKGWQQVDPTGGGTLHCGIYHIPYFTTETGEMPILYLSMPQIDIVETD